MAEQEKPEKIELDEVMLAMDVVDTLRHEQQLVERELASDERDQALIEKVKRMYAAQGLEVTDEVIAAGVAALQENRFAYQAAPPRGPVWLANLYVRRNRLAKWAAMLAASLVGLFFSLPVCFCGAGSTPTAKTGQKFQYHHQPAAGSAQRGQTAADRPAAGLGPGRKSPAAAEVAAKRLLAEAGQQLAGAETRLQAL